MADLFLVIPGSHLNDQQWHTIEIIRKGPETRLILDGQIYSKNITGPNLNFGDRSQNSKLYIGGLPANYMGRLSMLSLPSILFEPRFRGSIRNLRLSHCGRIPENVEMLDYDGVKTTDADKCANLNAVNRCQNRGVCISTDNGYFCDCTRTGFIGDRCEIGKY